MSLLPKIYILILLIINIIIFIPKEVYAIEPLWKEVPETNDGRQLWDQNSIEYLNNDMIRFNSKFIPKNTNKSSEKHIINYLMEVDCSNKLYRDALTNGLRNQTMKWFTPEGDALIEGVIIQSCSKKTP